MQSVLRPRPENTQGESYRRMFSIPAQSLIALVISGCLSSCALTRNSGDWTFANTPAINDPVALPVGGVICSSLAGAQFMASTGFFSPDCVSEAPEFSLARVQEITHHEQNGVAMKIVMTTIDFTPYWIPLPDHNWI